MRILVLGGIRSGKSRWAEAAISAAVGHETPVRYLATGVADGADADFSTRIDAHRDRRPSHWSTIESADLASELSRDVQTPTLVDDIGGWLTAAMDRRDAWRGGSIAADATELVGAVDAFGAELALVSPEVGLTVVPASESGRRFADELGSLNHRLADVCDRVVLVIAGQPIPVKEPT